MSQTPGSQALGSRTADPLAAERAALADLFARPDPLAALAADGWLEALPDPGGAWETAGVATAAAEAGAAAERPVSAGSLFAGAAALAAAGADPDGLAGVLVDVRADGDELRGRLWAPAAADRVVVALPGGGLGVAALDAAELGDDPLLGLDRVDVRTARIPASRVDALAGPEPGAVHLGRVAHLLAAEAIAAAEAATARTLDYLGSRQQFGRPIGAEQALQHRIVDMHLRCLSARTTLDRATDAWEAGDDERATVQAWRAKLLAGDGGVWTIENAIQLHGGIGFTEELGLGRSLWAAQRARALLGGHEAAALRVAAAVPGVPAPAPIDRALEFAPASGSRPGSAHPGSVRA